ncbi:MAG TPA: alpha/beta hydrolase [Verrucomicrobiae bacterium]|nr:alpha/beta hydrolase [Verrucomicrobiae bacterium]
MESAAKRRVLNSLFVVSPLLLYSTYLAIRRAGVAVLYRPAPLGDCQAVPDLSYCDDCTSQKHRLDLYLPPTRNWPMFVFVHGGALISGDKCLRVCGADVYGNIGRFYASRGIGVALINYRLQPQVTWREQVDDVARATAWLYTHAQNYGGDSSRLFIGGHSAGAQLAARVALDAAPLRQYGLSPTIVKAVIAVSGAGFDLRDEETYELGRNLYLYEARFRGGDPTDQWKTAASPITFASPAAPPFLIIYPQGETRALKRQSNLLHAALREQGTESELVVIPGENHCRMVLALSRADKAAAPAILSFIEKFDTAPKHSLDEVTHVAV